MRISTRTLFRLVSDGFIPASRIGTIWRFNRADLENYVGAMESLQIEKQKGGHV